MNKKEVEKPTHIVGVFADIQYADIDNAVVFGRTRFYRNGIVLMRKAVREWLNMRDTLGCQLPFILQLGDLMEGYRVKHPSDVLVNTNTLLSELSSLLAPTGANGDTSTTTNVCHIYGNHESHGLKRSYLATSLLNTARHLGQQKPNNANYYYQDVGDKLRIICLDTFERSVLGYEKTDPIYIESMKLLAYHAEVRERAAANGEEESEYNERFRLYNGAPGDLQMQWLREQLVECRRVNKKCIIAGHIPLTHETGGAHLCWNAEDLCELMGTFSTTVIAYLSGHYHRGGYKQDKYGIHHMTVPAILETSEDANSFVTIKVFDDRIEFDNRNKLASFTVQL